MIIEDFSLASVIKKTWSQIPSMRMRDRDKFTRNAGDAAKCHRQVAYKALGFKETNPPDKQAEFKMKFGDWIEKGLMYSFTDKCGFFGVQKLATQGDSGERDTFYGTSWNGYRDLDIAILQKNGTYKPCVVELKSKVGKSATMAIRETLYSKAYKIPVPDQTFGQAQQLSLYLRDAYNKSKGSKHFTSPIVDGVLLQLLYDDYSGIQTFVEYWAEYLPEHDAVKFYRVHCHDVPEVCAHIDVVIKLEDIAKRFSYQNEFIAKGELPPPEFQRKYPVSDSRVQGAYKTTLQAAVKGQALVGDVQCKYCSFRDQCAKDCNTSLTYSEDEVKQLKAVLKNL